MLNLRRSVSDLVSIHLDRLPAGGTRRSILVVRLSEDLLIDEASRSTMSPLAEWTVEAEGVLVF